MGKVSKEYKFEYQNKAYRAEVDIEIVTDYHYGADADGNRGEKATFIEDVEVTKLYEIGTKGETEVKVTSEIEGVIEDKVRNEGVVSDE